MGQLIWAPGTYAMHLEQLGTVRLHACFLVLQYPHTFGAFRVTGMRVAAALIESF